MLQDAISNQRINHVSMLLNQLTQSCQLFGTVHLFMDERASQITSRLLSESDIYGTGLIHIHRGNSIQDKDIDKIIVLTVFNEAGRTQIEKYLHLFRQILIINLDISSKQTSQTLKVSPIRKKMKGFIQIPLNFLAFVNSVYTVNQDKIQSQSINFQQSLACFLTSQPKFHQFQINYVKSHKLNKFAENIQTALKEKLQILQRHQSSQYKSSSSPRIKILLLNRNLDKMSPLIYSYYFGAVAKELGQLQGKLQYTVHSRLYSTLFSMDIQQSCEFLQKIAQQKAQNQKMNFKLDEFDKAKKAITNHYDTKSSSAEINMHIDSMQAIKEFCQKRALTTSLQHSLVNGISAEGEKMTGSKVVAQFQKWSKLPESFNFSQQDYIKLLILAYMVNSFWFFQRWVLNACIPATKKQKIVEYCKRVQGKFRPLKEKQQGQDRFDLFRHQSIFVQQIKTFLKGETQYQTIHLNKSVVNRQTQYIVAINGAMGYNQICQILNETKKTPNIKLSIFCDRLLTTKAYLQQLLDQGTQ